MGWWWEVFMKKEVIDQQWELLKLNQWRSRLQFITCDRGFDDQKHCVFLFPVLTHKQTKFHFFVLLSFTWILILLHLSMTPSANHEGRMGIPHGGLLNSWQLRIHQDQHVRISLPYYNISLDIQQYQPGYLTGILKIFHMTHLHLQISLL